MSDLPDASLAWLAEHHGVITANVFRVHGVGRSTIDRLVAAGVMRHPAKSVFVIASSPPTFEQRCAVLSAAHPNGFVTGPSAGTLARLRRMPSTTMIHVAVRHGRHLAVEPGVTWRQTRALTSADRQERDGIVVASWPGWPSISPPTFASSTTSRWSTSWCTSVG